LRADQLQIDETQKGEPVSVLFALEQEQSEYPVSFEQIWCLPVQDDIYLIDNIPFYARDVSIGDEIRTKLRDGGRWFTCVTKPSTNTTLRMFARNPTFEPLLRPKLESFGGQTEKIQGSPLIAVSLPPSADIASALDFLDRENEAGNVSFEESCVRYR
jgi:hypothetical protein